MSQLHLLNTAPDHFYDIPPLGAIPSSTDNPFCGVAGGGRGPGFLDAANELLVAMALSLQYVHMHSSWASVCSCASHQA